MNNTLTFLSTCFLFLGFVAPSVCQNVQKQQKARIEAEVDSVFHASVKDAERLDYDLLSKGVDDKYKAGFISNGTWYDSYDSLVETVKSRSQGIARQTIAINNEKITVLSETVVLLSAAGVADILTTNGNSFTAKFFWTFVYEKSGGAWKVIQSHQSTVK